MHNKLQSFLQTARKLLLFALYGGIGCLLAAVLGEIFLSTLQPPPTPPVIPHAVILLIDTSGSMKGEKLQEVKNAAIQFVQRRQTANLSKTAQDSLGIVQFGGNTAIVVTPLTQDSEILVKSINSLEAGGATPTDEGLRVAAAQLQKMSGKRSILLFTDGYPEPINRRTPTLKAGENTKKLGIRIVSVATDDVAKNKEASDLLNRVSDVSHEGKSLVFPAKVGNLEQAFAEAEKAIYECSPIDKACFQVKEPISPYYSLLRVGGWTALLAIGITLFLIIGQNHYLKRRFLTLAEGLKGIIGSLIAGLLAGGISLLLFAPLGNVPFWENIGRIVAWTFLGILLGIGMSFFVPNLKLRSAALGGGIGGAIGVIGFLLIAELLSDTVGRLVGAMIIGLCIGFMVALIEEIVQNTAYLLVSWRANEQVKIALGNTPIIAGSSNEAHIYLGKKFPSIVARIYVEDTKIMLDNRQTGQQRTLQAGEIFNLGGVTITLVSG